jgi:hypothetical protein
MMSGMKLPLPNRRSVPRQELTEAQLDGVRGGVATSSQSSSDSSVNTNPVYQPSGAVEVNPLYEGSGCEATNPLF